MKNNLEIRSMPMASLNQVLLTRRAALLGLAGAAAHLVGCGGGGTDTAGLSSGGTGSFTSGTITGFGSIIVNGIRYNVDTASVFTGDGAGSSNAALQLGMVVSIEGSAAIPGPVPTALPTATAYRVSYDSEWTGPVSNIRADTFEILGHTVDVLSTTLVGGVIQSYAELTSAHFVEVYGYVDQIDGHIQASRIEVSSVRPSLYKLSGAISQIDRIGQSAMLGRTPIAWALASDLSAAIVDGAFVRVRLNPVPVDAVWTATRLDLQSSPLASLSDDRSYEAEVEGSITAYESNANFTVSGITVNAASAQVVGTLRVGAIVEVEGSIQSGQLMATKVEIKTSSETESKEFEFYGVLSALTNQSFVVRGQTFNYDANTEHMDRITGLVEPRVKVKAIRTNDSWYAIEVEIDD